MALNFSIISSFGEAKSEPSLFKKRSSKKSVFSFFSEGIKVPVPVILDEIIEAKV